MRQLCFSLSPTRYRGAREKWLDVRYWEPFLQLFDCGRSSILFSFMIRFNSLIMDSSHFRALQCHVVTYIFEC